MDLSRRAQPNAPIPEVRRNTENFKPVTTAAYGSTIPLLIGRQRVPSTVIRDGRKPGTIQSLLPTGEATKVLYGLSEGPIAAIINVYTNDKVQMQSFPSAFAHPGAPQPYVAIDAPTGDDTPEDVSFECITDTAILGNSTGTDQFFQADGTAALNEDSAGLPATFASDVHTCITGAGATAVQWMVRFDRAANTISVASRTIGGTWSAWSVICSGSVNSAIRPVSGAMVQPRIAAVGSLVHVVWSVLDNTYSPVQIAHLWSVNSGSTWTAGQSLSLGTRTSTAQVLRLQVYLHSSGEVWISFHRRSGAGDFVKQNYPGKGVVVAFLPSTATASTPWVIPPTVSDSMIAFTSGELCVFDFSTASSKSYAGQPWRFRGASVLPLGGGRAILSGSLTYPASVGSPSQLVAAPIAADTAVHWDLPSAAFQWGAELLQNNIANLAWLNTNGFPCQALSFGPGQSVDGLNDGATQIFATGANSFGVLYLKKPILWNGNGSTVAAEMHGLGGDWALSWGTWAGSPSPASISWGFGATAGPVISYVQQATAFYNGNGQVWISCGSPQGNIGITDYQSRDLALYVATPGSSSLTQSFTYQPAISANASFMYQIWPQNGNVLVVMREYEDATSSYIVTIREVNIYTGWNDFLPSIIASRLMVNDLRGLNIASIVFDTVTWTIFDNYCKAVGIKFSLLLLSQQAAWPLVCDVVESANAICYRSSGLLKVLVWETASITANGATYSPLPEHAGSVVTIPAKDLRDGLSIETLAMDQSWNVLRVTWKNRARGYADEPYELADAGSIARKGRIPASSASWDWICDPQVVATCTFLAIRRQMRTGRKFKFALSQKYMLLEPGDIVTVSWPPRIPALTVRIISIEEGDMDWLECVAEDATVSTTTVQPPSGGTASTGTTIITALPVNLPILFVALIGGIMQVWALLSGPQGWRGCNVWQSWDSVTFSQVGTCTTASPTGHLVQDMYRLRVRPGLRARPGLKLSVADFAVGDFSESGICPPFPSWSDWSAGNPGALLWVDGELMAYGLESDDGRFASCSMMNRGLYGTTVAGHPALSRVGAVTDAAWTWPIPPGGRGRTCYFRFPSFGEDVANVPTYSVEIPA